MVGLPPRFLRATFSIHAIDLLITEGRNFIFGLTSLKACVRARVPAYLFAAWLSSTHHLRGSGPQLRPLPDFPSAK